MTCKCRYQSKIFEAPRGYCVCSLCAPEIARCAVPGTVGFAADGLEQLPLHLFSQVPHRPRAAKARARRRVVDHGRNLTCIGIKAPRRFATEPGVVHRAVVRAVCVLPPLLLRSLLLLLGADCTGAPFMVVIRLFFFRSLCFLR